ncbi:trypsin-like peptidase domain-containing protein [Methylocella sp.]|uniref:trypsin-like peptidase domain-containing protein n=1 Tax=Methylocella sp. TaxID=1978226 RepID=UPI003782F2CC
MRLFTALTGLILCLAHGPAPAAPRGAPDQARAYDAAEAAFLRLAPADRLAFKVLLTGAGYWVVVPTLEFSPKLFDAVARFQSENGLAPTGAADRETFSALTGASRAYWRLWGFRAAPHPARGRPIWIPFGLGLSPERNKDGLRWSGANGRVSVAYSYLGGIDPAMGLNALLSFTASKGGLVRYRVLRPDFFALSSSVGGDDKYARCHRDGGGLLCFFLSWAPDAVELHMERVAVLMSGSFAAAMDGAPFPPIPDFAPAPKRPPEVAVARPPEPAPSPEPKRPRRGVSSGTGFFVSLAGDVLTNAHVVEECARVTVQPDGGATERAEVAARDVENDLALLRTGLKPKAIAALRSSARLGEGVEAFGFPLNTTLASSGNFTLGNVTALAGLSDDSRHLQISTPVQPGNSGGPLLDQYGNVVGVVSAKLDALKVVAATGDVPQNVNFAIKGALAQSFLQSARVDYAEGTARETIASPDLADRARAISVFIRCE